MIPREFLRAIGAHRKYLMEAPKLHKVTPDTRPCVIDVLCHCKITIGRKLLHIKIISIFVM